MSLLQLFCIKNIISFLHVLHVLITECCFRQLNLICNAPSDPWVNRKKKGKKKPPPKKRQSTQEKIDSLLFRPKAGDSTKSLQNVPHRDAIERACSMKEDLLTKIERLGERLPPNTLDQLIDELGGPENVAEVHTDAY